ncbi:hypothetical protein Clacol_004403 [Clathrus columnatus]|uniref:Uncharacterized protein n=1 Tax=Clathrus columnatus TaxID=1419009 RepID=A0AAV5A911_9AGAM|nr:hypothetical protein Clacol_004403 [Clathrus columnatus]
MSTSSKHSCKGLEALITSKTGDLEEEFKQLGEELDKKLAPVAGLEPPPCIWLNDSITLVFFSRVTDVLELNATHSVVYEKTGEVIRYAPMKVFAKFDPGPKKRTMSDDD